MQKSKHLVSNIPGEIRIYEDSYTRFNLYFFNKKIIIISLLGREILDTLAIYTWVRCGGSDQDLQEPLAS